jgi:chromosome partitioning protein
MLTIAFCNQKGGVGKTTTTFHLTRSAARKGLRTLAVDLDPQGNLTQSLAKEVVEDGSPALADALSFRESTTLADVIVPTWWDGVDLAPTADVTLAEVRDELFIKRDASEHRLNAILEPLKGSYDLVLIDCPPSLDLLTTNGLVAADKAAIVVTPDMYSQAGMVRVLHSALVAQSYYNKELEIAGIIVNDVRSRTNQAKYRADEIQEFSEERNIPVYAPPIPHRQQIADSREAAKGLDEFGGRGYGELLAIYDHYLSLLMGIDDGYTPEAVTDDASEADNG